MTRSLTLSPVGQFSIRDPTTPLKISRFQNHIIVRSDNIVEAGSYAAMLPQKTRHHNILSHQGLT